MRKIIYLAITIAKLKVKEFGGILSCSG